MAGTGVASALAVQGRVVWALMLREIHTLYGGDRLGYLWVIIQNSFGVAVFWGLRYFMGFKAPHGMSVPAFLISGFMIWNIFSSLILKSVAAARGNQALLTFPQVTQIDLLLARAGVIVVTEVVVAVLLLALSFYFGYPLDTPNWAGTLGAVALAAGLGLGLGGTLAALNIIMPILEKLLPMVFRILFFVSGIFFSLTAVPYGFRAYLAWNPALQLIEWLRVSLAPAYPATYVNVPYLTLLSLITMTLGLLLERRVRRYAAG
ncbi:MAG: ABC transporter permease [Candidatus Adiutrix sp.]|nr:ABC transporter permease [Candidatus Adiutrix sp.]